MDIDLAGLLVFRHLAATGNFSDTGRYWKIPQPAVSLMISRLETAVGLVLFERSPSGARLTSAGTAFLERADEVCGDYLSFIDGMRSLSRRMDREVVVGMDRSWFSEKVRDFCAGRTLASGVKVALHESNGNWSEALEMSRIDVALAGRFLRAGLSSGIQEGVIRRERGITVAWNPAFYPFDPVEFNFPEVLRCTVLFPDRGVVSGFTSFMLRWCREAYDIQPANVIEFKSEQEAVAAANAGIGVLLTPGEGVPRWGSAGDDLVHVRTFEFLLPEAFTYGVYCRREEDSKDVLAVAAAFAVEGRSALAADGTL